MTYNYSATLYTCLQNFYEEVNMRTLEGVDKKKITDYFVNFYKFLETLFDNKNFFKNSITELNEQLLGLLRQENSLIIYLNDESSTALHYFTQKERRINIITKTKERSTVLFWEPTQQLD